MILLKCYALLIIPVLSHLTEYGKDSNTIDSV